MSAKVPVVSTSFGLSTEPQPSWPNSRQPITAYHVWDHNRNRTNRSAASLNRQPYQVDAGLFFLCHLPTPSFLRSSRFDHGPNDIERNKHVVPMYKQRRPP